MNGTMPNIGNTIVSTARCQMNRPYDHRPTASATGLARIRCRCPARTSGASNAKLMTAPRAIFVAYCHGSARTSPSGPASHVVDNPKATTAITAIHTRRSARRCTHVPPTIASSASNMPAANHGM
ncbi:hypothetical protein KAREA_42730 [Prescottella equi]|nr:hypothetical protein RE9414_42100 [Prescottella equi]BDC74358.1 hypothetical protein KAREA_42730 [Prescottella equi]